MIARVEGRGITKADFDRSWGPYFAQLRATMGGSFTADVRRTAELNVFDELIRREVLTFEAERGWLAVTEAATGSVLMRDPTFATNGVFDSTTFRLLKQNPASNYAHLMPQIRVAAAMNKLDRVLRRRIAPSRPRSPP